jgi:hypothetical protein
LLFVGPNPTAVERWLAGSALRLVGEPRANGFVRCRRSQVMASDSCDGCGRTVSIAGGIANLWSFDADATGGLALELADDSEYFLCFACIDRLPDEPRAEDVAALDDAEDAQS